MGLHISSQLFCGVIVQGLIIWGSNFRGTIVRVAIIRGTIVWGTIIQGAIVRRTIIRGVIVLFPSNIFSIVISTNIPWDQSFGGVSSNIKLSAKKSKCVQTMDNLRFKFHLFFLAHLYTPHEQKRNR